MSESVWAMAPERAAVLPVEKEQGWGKKQKDHSPPNPPSPSLCPITLPGRRTNVLPRFLGGILVCALEWYMHFIECVNIDTILFYFKYVYIYIILHSFPFLLIFTLPETKQCSICSFDAILRLLARESNEWNTYAMLHPRLKTRKWNAIFHLAPYKIHTG